ncbi:ganglioside-induced differentiation-associated protein 1-like [Glandiceps talaboti]
MSQEGLVLYLSKYSPFARRVWMTLIEKGLSYEIYEVLSLTKSENHTEWYLRLHPLGKVPALRHKDEVITDSSKILEYLENKFPEAPKLYPSIGTKEYAKVKSILSLIDDDVPYLGTLHLGVGNFQEFAKNPMFSLDNLAAWTELKRTREVAKLKKLAEEVEDMKEVCERKIAYLLNHADNSSNRNVVEDALKKYGWMFGELEKLAVPDIESKWICGEQYTVADICVSNLIDHLVKLGLQDYFFGNGKHALLLQYFERARQRDSFTAIGEEGRSWNYHVR